MRSRRTAAGPSSRTPARAWGPPSDGRPLGSFGDASVFAFYPNKQITTGEGGMVVTDDDALAETMRSLRNQGRDSDGTWLRHVRLGYNYRLDEMSAAVGVAQLERLAELRARAGARRRGLRARHSRGADWITAAGRRRRGVGRLVRVRRPARPRHRPGRADRRPRRSAASPSRPYFSPIHLQPFYRQTFGFQPGRLPGHRAGGRVDAGPAVLESPDR